MATNASAVSLSAISERLVTAALPPTAIDRYPWPLPCRIAGYVTLGAALFGTVLSEGFANPVTAGLSFVLGALIIVGFHYLSGCRDQMRPHKRAALVAGQLICAILLSLLTNTNSGPAIFFYAVAAELQFLTSFRAALAGTTVIWAISVALCTTVQHAGTVSLVLADAAVMSTGFVFVAAFTHSAVVELIQRNESTLLLDKLNDAHARLQKQMEQVEELAAARERNRLAHEIHDTLGHYLTVINVQLETAQKLARRDAMRSEVALTTAKGLASECLAEVRRSVAALRPGALEEMALPEAIAVMIDDLRRACEATIYVESQGSCQLTPAVEVVVYRILQEALTNVRKHAHARHVWLRLEWGPDRFTMTLHDDGRGANLTDHQAGFGLRGMRERAAAIGGTLDIATAPGAGFILTLRTPCLAAAPIAEQYTDGGVPGR